MLYKNNFKRLGAKQTNEQLCILPTPCQHSATGTLGATGLPSVLFVSPPVSEQQLFTHFRILAFAHQITMSLATRQKVLAAYRQISRTCRMVFAGDTNALTIAQNEVQNNFRKNKDECDPEKIGEDAALHDDAGIFPLPVSWQRRW